jgi:hypothetical protein
MKACPFCAEDIQDAAKVCKHCGRDLATGAVNQPASVSPPPNAAPAKKKTSPVAMGCAVLLILFLGMCVITMSKMPTTPSEAARGAPAPGPAAAVPTPPLVLHSWRWSENYGYAIVEGEVENASAEPLQRVMAVATFYTKDGQLIGSADSMIDYQPILSKQKSPFKVMHQWNPAMENAKLTFKSMFGGTIDFKEAAKPTPRPKKKP